KLVKDEELPAGYTLDQPLCPEVDPAGGQVGIAIPVDLQYPLRRSDHPEHLFEASERHPAPCLTLGTGGTPGSPFGVRHRSADSLLRNSFCSRRAAPAWEAGVAPALGKDTPCASAVCISLGPAVRHPSRRRGGSIRTLAPTTRGPP